jgi:hypothetical protein
MDDFGRAVERLIGTRKEVAVKWSVDGSWFMERCRIAVFIPAFLAFSWSDAVAHEGHAPLPSKGAVVDLDRGLVQLSRIARGTRHCDNANPANVVDRFVACQRDGGIRADRSSICCQSTPGACCHASGSSRRSGRGRRLAGRGIESGG